MTKKIDQRVNVNTATLDELSAVPGLGPALALRVNDGRPYAKLEELTKVRGIGPKSLAPLLPYLTVTPLPDQETSETDQVDTPASEPRIIITKETDSVRKSPIPASLSISTLLPVFVILGITTVVLIILRALTHQEEETD